MPKLNVLCRIGVDIIVYKVLASFPCYSNWLTCVSVILTQECGVFISVFINTQDVMNFKKSREREIVISATSVVSIGSDDVHLSINEEFIYICKIK